jgi:hypothetical protein
VLSEPGLDGFDLGSGHVPAEVAEHQRLGGVVPGVHVRKLLEQLVFLAGRGGRTVDRHTLYDRGDAQVEAEGDDGFCSADHLGQEERLRPRFEQKRSTDAELAAAVAERR